MPVPTVRRAPGSSGARRSRRRLHGAALAGACALLLGGCSASEEAPALSEEDFVGAYAELRRAEASADGAAEFEQLKAEILARYDTSEEELMAFVASREGDPGAMAEVWDSVQARLQRPDGEAPEPSGGVPPEGSDSAARSPR